MIDITRYESGLLSSNMYVVKDGDYAIVIDPFESADEVESLAAAGVSIDYIILTHEHYDHISGSNYWREKTNAPILCSESCAENIKNPRTNFSRIFKVFCELQTWIKLDSAPQGDVSYSSSADITFRDKMALEWCHHDIELFELPGHSDGSIGVIIDEKFFFSGDSLIEDNEVELRLPGGNKDKWKEVSEPRLAKIPDGTLVYPGHFKEFVLERNGR